MKKAFTLVEALVSMLIISAVGMATLQLLGSYFKYTYECDQQINAMTQSINTIEKLKAEVKTLSQLYAFSLNHKIKVIAVGIGEVNLTKSADEIEITITQPENNVFSDKLYDDSINLFRVEVNGDLPNTKLSTILRLEKNPDG